MSELISKETLICEIVNTLTNSDGYNSAYQTYTTAYHSGSATRQFEILDIINKLPTVSEQEIRNKVIEELKDKICSHFADWQYAEDDKWIKDIIELASESVEEIAEQMKEVGE